jgi:PAS domain S-box-containing protein
MGDWSWDVKTNQVHWSDELYRIYGYEPRSIEPDYALVVAAMHPDSKETFLKNIAAALSGERPFEMDYTFFRRDGSAAILHTIGRVIRDGAGTPVQMVGTVQDITAQKAAEAALRESEARYRTLFHAVDEGFIIIDRDFRIVTANRAYERMFAENGEEVIGRRCYEVAHGADRPCHERGLGCSAREVFERGESPAVLHRHAAKNGNTLYFETRAFPIRDDSGAVVSVIETINDVTEKLLLSEERLKTQKLEAIGVLAGGIAHDFNNLLQGLFGYLSMAKITLDQKERSLAMLEQAEQALHLSVNLTKQLLTFSKGGKPVKSLLSLRTLLENSVKFALSGSRAGCRIECGEDLWMVEADEGQIGQVIQNIVLNADQAMPLGGTVTVSAKNVAAPGQSHVHALGKGNYVLIEIQDSGIGIPEQYLEKIFDPYFSTKEKGSGLGLATSYSIVRNHGGLIDVASEPGKGTTFSIALPAAAATNTPAAVRTSARAGRRGKVLLMDDEELVRTISGEMIREDGHEVEFAEDGQTAIEKYKAAREAGAPFDIVILDLTVRGGLGGKETIKALRAIDPGLKAVVSSGYSDDSAVADYKAHRFDACLTKPYEFGKLRETLSVLLDNEHPGQCP